MAITEELKIVAKLELDPKQHLKAIKAVEKAEKVRARASDARVKQAVKGINDQIKWEERLQQRITNAVKSADRARSQSLTRMAIQFVSIEKAISFAKQSLDRYIDSNRALGEHQDVVREASEAWGELQESVGALIFELGDGIIAKAFTGIAHAIRDASDAILGFDRAQSRVMDRLRKDLAGSKTQQDVLKAKIAAADDTIALARQRVATEPVSRTRVSRAEGSVTEVN